MPKIVIFGVLAAIGILLSLTAAKWIPHTNSHSDEGQHVKNLLIACYSFSSDNDAGKFPMSLDELHPDYIEDKQYLMFKNHKTGESKPYKYFPNLKNTDFSGSPLIASPVIKSKKYDFRIVGYVDGHVARVRGDEYAKPIEYDPHMDIYSRRDSIKSNVPPVSSSPESK